MEAINNTDMYTNDYFESLIKDSSEISKSEIIKFIQPYTNDFEKVRLKYFIEDLREYIYKIPFALKRENSDILCYDHITGELMYFYATGLSDIGFHYNPDNNFDFEQWQSGMFFEKIVFNNDSSLSERIDKLKNELSNLYFKCRIRNIIRLSEICEYQYNTTAKEQPTATEAKRFETKLTDAKRLDLCNKIIEHKGAESEKHKPIFKDITEKHIPTLLYILGSEYPEKIEKIKVCSIGRTHTFLESISKHPHPYEQGKICVPDFLKNALLQSNGNGILKLKK